MGISKDRFREALNEFYSKEVLFKLYNKYFLDWIAEGYIGSNLGLFEISLICENSNKQTFIDLLEQVYLKKEVFCTAFSTLDENVKEIFKDIVWNGKVFISPKDREKYFHHPKFAKRVVADYGLLDQKMTLEKLEEHICTNITNNQKVLVEFIKKKSAEEFYERMKEQTDYPVLVMTGDSSIQERKRIIEKIQELESAILIATQVIEAGVDIDMDIGYKDISRLDSEEQFMGRINRSAKRRGTVYFFDMDDAGKIYEGDVRGEDRFSLKTTAMREILTTKNFPKFYEENILPAVKESGSGINEENVKYFFRESVQKLKFPEIDNRMKLIEDDRHMISVYLGREVMGEDKEIIDGRKIWEEYKDLLENETIEYSEKIVKLRNLRSKMNEFIYQFSEKTKFQEDEQIGDIYYIENGEKYFDENGVLNRKILENEADLFL